MKTSIDVLDRFLPIINVSSVTSLISGGVYLDKRPTMSKSRDIVITSLPVSPLAIQTGIVNINIYCEDFSDGTRNVDYFNQVSKAVLSALDNHSISGEYFDYDIVWQTIISEDNGFSFANIRLRYYLENID